MTSQNQIRIAMWSGPRNISTAMMRSFENREDTFVIDEPFYAYYLYKTGFDHPGREDVIKAQSTKWEDIVELIIGKIPEKKLICYQKHMVHHIENEQEMLFQQIPRKSQAKTSKNHFLVISTYTKYTIDRHINLQPL